MFFIDENINERYYVKNINERLSVQTVSKKSFSFKEFQ